MKEIIPLLQTLIWPVFILILLLIARHRIFAILEAILFRIESGAPFEAGTSGIKLGASSSPKTTLVATESGSQLLSTPKKTDIEKKDVKVNESLVNSEKTKVSADINPGYFIVHKARRDRSLDFGEYEYYRLRIFIETDLDVNLNDISKVIYHLHPTFTNPDRVVSDPDMQFELRTTAWGQFNLTADVYLKNREKPLKLERYLNF